VAGPPKSRKALLLCRNDECGGQILSRYEIVSKLPGPGEKHEFIGSAQVRYVCTKCGYCELYMRDHKEHREAAEEQRRLERGGA
jgi:predicted nucleic-acid-binding Zn-ribbon protein